VKEARCEFSLILTERNLCVLHSVTAVSPIHREIQGLKLQRGGKANGRRKTKLKLRSEELIDLLLTLGHGISLICRKRPR
jgi:hypothetical protein